MASRLTLIDGTAQRGTHPPSARARRLEEVRAASEGQRWQALKSEQTRQDIVDAAVRCLLRDGYAGTTTTVIAREAGISRGAASHHFPNKQAVVEATLDRLVELRRADFCARISAIAPDADHTSAGIQAYWEHLCTPEHLAYQELILVARADPDLAQIVAGMIEAFEEVWEKDVRRLFPEWDDAVASFSLALDVTQFLMEGMALHGSIVKDGDRYAKVRAFLIQQLRTMLADKQRA